MENNLQTACERIVTALLRNPLRFEQVRKGASRQIRRYQLAIGDRDVAVCVVIQRRIRPAELAQLAEKYDGTCEQRMIFAEHITAGTAELLRERGIWFADAQGNAFIEIPGQLLLQASGNRPSRLPTPTGQHFSAPGGKILHYLLKHGPRIHATYRDIREAIGVSIDKIGKLIRELEQREALQVHGTGNYEILVPDRLLVLWIDAYEAKLKPALLLGRYAHPVDLDFGFLIHEAARALPGQVVVAGEVAADAFTQHLRPEILRLYIPKESTEDVRRKLKLAPSNRGNIELCDLYSPDIASGRPINDALLADPVLVYAELMAEEDDRLAETAMRLRQEFLSWTL